jgi:hypothetical protein
MCSLRSWSLRHAHLFGRREAAEIGSKVLACLGNLLRTEEPCAFGPGKNTGVKFVQTRPVTIDFQAIQPSLIQAITSLPTFILDLVSDCLTSDAVYVCFITMLEMMLAASSPRSAALLRWR